MLEITRAEDRGVAEHGWLSSRHTFSFANYHNPKQIGFSDLLVINDDRVAPGKGFGQHSHRDVEIFSYVLEGALEHKDTLGTGAVIRPGDVQTMSAGSGVAHSEFNHSQTETVHFLQIWIMPNRQGVKPRYQQKHFSPESKRGRLTTIISPDGKDGSLTLYQDANIYAGLFDGAETATFEVPDDRYAYVHVARGSLSVNQEQLGAGDGLRVRREKQLRFERGDDAEVIVFDLRPHETPER